MSSYLLAVLAGCVMVRGEIGLSVIRAQVLTRRTALRVMKLSFRVP
jgi:hypothetical protein